jgi:hypothetical protein
MRSNVLAALADKDQALVPVNVLRLAMYGLFDIATTR